MVSKDISNEFERLIESGQMQWRKAKISELSEWGQGLVEEFLYRHNIKWELGSEQIENAVCLKLDDPKIKYLDIFSNTKQFMWCTEGHHNSIHPDEVLIYLFRKNYPQNSYELGQNGTIIINDGQIVLHDMRKKY
jgi:hypothetical protein